MKRKQYHGPPRGSAKRVALPRFQKEHWPRWLEIAEDRAAWRPTFKEWQQEVEARASRLREAGLEVVWIDLEPDSFLEWCMSRGYSNDAEARSRFASEQIGNIPPSSQPEQPQKLALEARNGRGEVCCD